MPESLVTINGIRTYCSALDARALSAPTATSAPAALQPPEGVA